MITLQKKKKHLINWKDLIVTDLDGYQYRLDRLIEFHDFSLTKIELKDGKISSWSQYLISAPEETPNWDTPKVEVDWTGFKEALKEALP